MPETYAQTLSNTPKKMLTRLFLVLACLSMVAPSFAATELVQMWVAETNMVMEGAPLVVDLNRDGDAEIVTAAYQAIIAIDGNGRELWRFNTDARYSTYPAILERADAAPLLYAGDNRGQLSCIDGSGELIWQVKTGSIFCAAPALADIDQNGSVEVVQGDKKGVLHVFDALTGDSVWTSRLDGEIASPALGDLGGDGSIEIVATTGAGTVSAVDALGSLVWRFAMRGTTPDWATCSPVIFGDSHGGSRIAVASGEERFYCLDSDGRVMWERATRGSIASTISVGDFDDDGRADIFAVTQLGTLYRFDEDGRTIWDIDTQGRCLAPGAIIDIDGDEVFEYLLNTQQGNMLVFDHLGEIVYSRQFDNRTINMTAAFGDIILSRTGLEFAVTGGESGKVFCFATSAPVDIRAQWRTYRGDNRLTGAWFGLSRSDKLRMVPESLSWDRLLTAEPVTFQIYNPQAGEGVLRSDASCLAPDGSRYAATGQAAGRTGLLELPITVTAPGVYHFEWSLTNITGEVLTRGSRELTLLPYAADQALSRRAVLELNNSVGIGQPEGGQNEIMNALRQEALEIEYEADILANLQTAAPGARPEFLDQLHQRTARLNDRARRAFLLAKIAESVQSAELNSPIALFEGLMWENRDVDSQLPSTIETPLLIERRCVVGEYEPVSIKLLNVTLDTVMVVADIDVGQNGPVVETFEVRAVPTFLGEVAWDPMAPLNNRSIAVPPLATREVFVDIDLAAIPPGRHSVTVSVNVGALRSSVEIALDVLAFEMAGFGAMQMCNWAKYEGDAVTDLLAHGNNVFITNLPPATVVEGDSATIEIDIDKLEQFLGQLAGHEVFLLMSGIPALGVEMESGAYVSRLAVYLGKLFDVLETNSITDDRVALYPHDEPGGHGWDTVNHYIAFARQGLKARPGLKFYVNGGGDLPMFEALGEVASVWSPSYYMLPEDTPEMRYLRNSGKTLWSYDCGFSYARPTGANTKTINVAGQYRMAAPFGFSFGATGIGYWCYNHGPSMWDPIRSEYPLVYANDDGTHTTSRRWKAVREGMEDARILIALRDKLSDQTIGALARTRISHLLDESLPVFARQSLEDVRIGAARYVLDATNNDAAVESFRSELLDCVESLVR